MSVKPIVTACALAMALVLTSGLGVTAATAQGQAKATAQADGSRRVCRTEIPSGSRLTRRTCRTQAEWEEGRSRTQESLLDHQRRESTQLEQAAGPMGLGGPPR